MMMGIVRVTARGTEDLAERWTWSTVDAASFVGEVEGSGFFASQPDPQLSNVKRRGDRMGRNGEPENAT